MSQILPLEGLHILITRNHPQSYSFQNQLIQQKAIPIVIPTIEIKDPPSWKLFDQIALEVSKIDWILFTSSNAVLQTQKRFVQLNIPLEKLSNKKIAVVGNQTKNTVESIGLNVELIPTIFEANSLISNLIKLPQNTCFWIPRALQGKNELPEELKKNKYEIYITPVYETIIPFKNQSQLQNTLQEKKIDWITFTSSSTAKNFFTLLEKENSIRLFPKIASIGKSTTSTLNELGYPPTFTASPQNIEGLIKGLKEYQIINSANSQR